MSTKGYKRVVRHSDGVYESEEVIIDSSDSNDAGKLVALNASGILDPSLLNAKSTSAGAVDAGKLPALNASGVLDASIINAKTSSAGAVDAGKLPALNGAGVLDTSIVNAKAASAGAADAGKLPALNVAGILDESFLMLQGFEKVFALARLVWSQNKRLRLSGADTIEAIEDEECWIVDVGDETTPISVGEKKKSLQVPYPIELTRAPVMYVSAAPTGQGIVADITARGNSLFKIRPTVDDGEKLSSMSSSATELAKTFLSDFAELTVDFVQVGSTYAGAGAKFYIYHRKSTEPSMVIPPLLIVDYSKASLSDPGNPTITPLFSRATLATVLDNEGSTVTIPANMARFQGARYPRNLVVSDIAQWSSSSNAILTEITEEEWKYSLTAVTNRGIGYAPGILQDGENPTGRTFRISLDITPLVDTTLSFNWVNCATFLGCSTPKGTQVIAISGVGIKRRISLSFTFPSSTSTGAQVYFFDSSNQTGDRITFGRVMVEEVTNRINKNPSEYVLNDGSSGSGLAVFNTANGNTVDVNKVVTEEAGYEIPGIGLLFDPSIEALAYSGFQSAQVDAVCLVSDFEAIGAQSEYSLFGDNYPTNGETTPGFTVTDDASGEWTGAGAYADGQRSTHVHYAANKVLGSTIDWSIYRDGVSLGGASDVSAVGVGGDGIGGSSGIVNVAKFSTARDFNGFLYGLAIFDKKLTATQLEWLSTTGKLSLIA